MDSDDYLISIANMIFAQLSIKKEIKSEEELFSDKVYIEIIGTLMQNIQGEITPGKTPEEKIENIGLLLSILNKLFETEFDIDPRKIIIEKDKESVNSLSELLFEITTTLLNSGAELEEDDDDLEDRKCNNSDPGMKKEDESVESLRLGKDKKSAKKSGKKSAKKEEKIKMEGLDKEKSQSGEDLFFDKDKHKQRKIVIHDVDLSNCVVDLTIHDVDLTIIDADSTPAYAFHVL